MMKTISFLTMALVMVASAAPGPPPKGGCISNNWKECNVPGVPPSCDAKMFKQLPPKHQQCKALWGRCHLNTDCCGGMECTLPSTTPAPTTSAPGDVERLLMTTPRPSNPPGTPRPTPPPNTRPPTTARPTKKPTTRPPTTARPTKPPTTRPPTTSRPTRPPTTPRPTKGPGTPRPTKGPGTPRPTITPATPRPTNGPQTPRPTVPKATPRPTTPTKPPTPSGPHGQCTIRKFVCEDKQGSVDGNKNHDCEWANKKSKRLKNVCKTSQGQQTCPKSCGVCCVDNDKPFVYKVKNGVDILKTCADGPFCNKKSFSKNCPVTCDTCPDKPPIPSP